MKGMEKIDRDDLFICDTRVTRGHNKKLKKMEYLRDIKKYSFPYRCIDIWNGLGKETVQAKNIHEFKAKVDSTRYGTEPHKLSSPTVYHNEVYIQLGKYTHTHAHTQETTKIARSYRLT